MTIKEARIAAGLTQAAMSEKMLIPRRTIENWESGVNKCPAWAERLVVAELMRIAEAAGTAKKAWARAEIRRDIQNKRELLEGRAEATKHHDSELIRHFQRGIKDLNDDIEAVRAAYLSDEYSNLREVLESGDFDE